ncbi:MAG: acetyl-CoA carboxylase biotin carboxyl carrier protein subunit [Burkholderiales bacterium]
MNTDQIEQLSAWLVATDIGVLELRGPGTQLRLRNDGGAAPVRQESIAVPPAPARPQARSLTVDAPSVGVFLHRHPLRDGALAPVGAQIRTGQPVGLLQIGALLLSICAPQAATVTGLRVAHGTAVGYGTPLVDLVPL